MKKIGNIIYDSELINHDQLSYINYYENIFDENIDHSLPTLFVGWINLKNSLINDNLDILNKEIVPNISYWEFSFSENKASHINGIIDFVNNLPKYFFEGKYSYSSIDPIFDVLKDTSEFFKLITFNVDRIYNYKNENLFLLTENRVIGVDLRIFEYFNFNTNEMVKVLSDSANLVINDLNGDLYVENYKLISNYTNLRRYIVVL